MEDGGAAFVVKRDFWRHNSLVWGSGRGCSFFKGQALTVSDESVEKRDRAGLLLYAPGSTSFAIMC
jgi:hypothetical protein